MKTEEKKFFPMFVDLSEKKAVVLGAGVIATRRVKTLLEYDGVVLGFNGSGKNHKKVKEVRQKTQKALEQSRKEEEICEK